MPYYLVEYYEDVPPENVNQIKEFVRRNGGEILEDLESLNGFSIHSAGISEDLVTRLKSHEDIEDIELDVLATNQSSSSKDASADPVLDDVVSLEKKRLIRYLGLETTLGRQPSGTAYTVQSLFFIESAPNSIRSAKCRLPGYNRIIQPDNLRLAIFPGIDKGWNNFKFRSVNVRGIIDGNYLVSGGVERLAKRDGLYNESKDRLPADFDSLLREAGSAVYQGFKMPNSIDRFEYYNLITTLAPNKSKDPGNKSHSKEDKLNKVQIRVRYILGEKAIRALKRLSGIPIPNI
ncbi:uncharacterized protein N7458_003065 [Penicillium daleae]|uniref:Uncharacterized protein n=1 Tax=Penicillium daleae TaxID=63821 RepID=A0AAD6G7S1_9EURO|nr:uncharacterized protein N7458_003065 [Penicillium daleae]KAJ5461513.1 hypothetical protein N7458_003065 [Penicillium daleae]